MRMLSLTIIAASSLGLGSAAAAQADKASRLSLEQIRATGGQGNAQGTPQRDPRIPSGLARNFARGVPGILRAIVATQGSNSRLQDLPASP